MVRSVLYFALGIALALVTLVVIALVVTNFTGDDPAPAPTANPSAAGPVGPDTQPAPTATPSAAGPVGPDTQPAPTDSPTATAPDAPTAQPSPTSTPSANMDRDLEIVTLLRKDAIPAILEPEFLAVTEADEQMKEDELVLGISIEGDSRAYSVNMLSRHEIANDVVGGMPVAVTW